MIQRIKTICTSRIWPLLPATGRSALCPLLLLTAAAAPLRAQLASVSGAVTDLVGEPLAGVEVVLLAVEGLDERQVAATRTDASGEYRFAEVAPGVYDLRFRRAGFAELRVEGIRLESGVALRRDATLVVAAFALDHITVTAQRQPERALDAPAGLSVVDAARIEERPSISVFDHMSELPGVMYAERGLVSRTYMIRGTTNVAPGGGAYTIADYRIASVPSLAFSVPYLLAPAEEDIERIEVLRGPASAMYGPNAIAGVLHLVTRSPFDSPGTSVSVASGERSTLRVAARHARTLGDDVAFRVSGNYFRGRDWEARDSLELTERDFDVEHYAAEARVDIRAGAGTDVVIAAGTATAASAIELVAPGAFQVKDWRYDYLQARVHRGSLFGQVFFNDNDAGDTFALRTLDPVVDRSRMIGAQLQHGIERGPTAWTYGLDLQFTDPRTGGTVNGRNEDDDNLLEAGAYVHGELRLAPRWRLIAATRLDNHSRVDGNFLSPRAALLFEPAPGHTLRATWNRAFRSPSTLDLFLDIRSARLEPTPYEVWVRAAPRDGWRFRRDCAGGPCMRTPFAPGEVLPLDATLGWQPLVDALLPFGIDLSGIPAPTPADVRTVLRTFDPNARTFFGTTLDAIRDIPPLKRTVASAWELGYKGLIANRLSLEADAYVARITGFIRGPFVFTPSVFLETTELVQYLERYLPPDRADQYGRIIGGAAGSTGLPGIPLGTIAPDDPTADHHITLTYESYGEVDQWGVDARAELLLAGRVSLSASYSRFELEGVAPGLGAVEGQSFRFPHASGSAGIRYRDDPAGVFATLSARFESGYDAHGTYEGRVEDVRVLDATVGYRLPFPGQPLLTVSAHNLLNRREPQQAGAPAIGRLLMARVAYGF